MVLKAVLPLFLLVTFIGQHSYSAETSKAERKEFNKLVNERNSAFRESMRKVDIWNIDKCAKSEKATAELKKGIYKTHGNHFFISKAERGKSEISLTEQGLLKVLESEDALTSKFPDAASQDYFWDNVRTYGNWVESYTPRFFLAALYLCDSKNALGTPQERKSKAEAQLKKMMEQLRTRIDALSDSTIRSEKRESDRLKELLANTEKLFKRLQSMPGAGSGESTQPAQGDTTPES